MTSVGSSTRNKIDVIDRRYAVVAMPERERGTRRLVASVKRFDDSAHERRLARCPAPRERDDVAAVSDAARIRPQTHASRLRSKEPIDHARRSLLTVVHSRSHYFQGNPQLERTPRTFNALAQASSENEDHMKISRLSACCFAAAAFAVAGCGGSSGGGGGTTPPVRSPRRRLRPRRSANSARRDFDSRKPHRRRTCSTDFRAPTR